MSVIVGFQFLVSVIARIAFQSNLVKDSFSGGTRLKADSSLVKKKKHTTNK
jgi:hypothetical protein